MRKNALKINTLCATCLSSLWVKLGHININNKNFLACSHSWRAIDSHSSFPWPTPQGLQSSQLFLGGPRVSLSSCLFRNKFTSSFLSQLFEGLHWPGHWEQHLSATTVDDVFWENTASLPHCLTFPQVLLNLTMSSLETWKESSSLQLGLLSLTLHPGDKVGAPSLIFC